MLEHMVKEREETEYLWIKKKRQSSNAGPEWSWVLKNVSLAVNTRNHEFTQVKVFGL